MPNKNRKSKKKRMGKPGAGKGVSKFAREYNFPVNDEKYIRASYGRAKKNRKK